jgi:hypothetical protein
MLLEVSLAIVIVDQEMLGQERRNDRAKPAVHPTRRVELDHALMSSARKVSSGRCASRKPPAGKRFEAT